MSTYDFEPNPEDYGPEPAHIANSQKVKANSKIILPPLPEPNVDQFSGHRERFVSYDSDHMQAYGQQCRAAALEEAIQAAQPEDSFRDVWFEAKVDVANRIRSIK